MHRNAAKESGGKWADDAFPPEASMNYADFRAEGVQETKKELEKQNGSETWVVVDGFRFPYADCT